jgi:hypothetical protein
MAAVKDGLLGPLCRESAAGGEKEKEKQKNPEAPTPRE